MGKKTQKIWKTKKYYRIAKEGSKDASHPGMKMLMSLSKESNNILDLGCGEGTRLDLITKGRNSKGVGVDISQTAIGLAKKTYPNLEFVKSDLEKLPFKKKSFDLVYSAYVLEHLSNPEKVLNEAIRVTERNGSLVFIAPNYGSPNRASPVYGGSRMRKFVNGFLKDIFRIISLSGKLNWDKVNPKEDNKYEVDLDTTIEPYIGSLIAFLRYENLIVTQASSAWNQELPNAKLHQRLFRFLGERRLYPFWMWGPHIVLVAKK